MPQYLRILESLKRELRARGLTYRDVAVCLDLSEASIKRLFSDGNFTLERLEKVCEMVDLGITDLVEISQRDRRNLDSLTLDQEKELAADIALLMVAVSVINGFSFTDLLNHYTLTEYQCIQKLARLDKIKFLELLPGNRIKLLISPNFRWQKNGPIQKFFHDKVEQDFFSSRFEGERDKLLVLNGLFSEASNSVIQEKMENFLLEFNALIKKDAALPTKQKEGTTMVLALREWRYSLFAEYVK